MNNQIFKRIAAAFVSVCLFISGSGVFAETNDIFAVPSNDINKSGERGNVRIIVELDDTPLLSYEGKISTYSSISDFLASGEAKGIEQRLEQKTQGCKKSAWKKRYGFHRQMRIFCGNERFVRGSRY